jgi:hypothetical protein
MGIALKKPAAATWPTENWLFSTLENDDTSCLPTSYPQKDTATVRVRTRTE